MKKIILLIFAFCVVTALLIVCGNLCGESGEGSLGDQSDNKNVIYIGVYEPLTGDYAQGGNSETLGIRYANSICPTVDIDGVTYKIKLVEADNATDDEESAFAAQTLVDSDVSAVLGSYGSKATAVGISIFEKKGIPLIGISCTNLSAKGDAGNYFRLCYTDPFQSGVLANLAYSIDCRNAAVLTQTGDEYSKEAGKAFTDAFIQLGGEVSDFSFQLGQENFRSLTEEIVESDTDLVVMLSGAFEAKYFIKQSRSLGLSCPILGPENWDSALLLSDVSYYYRDVYFSSEFDSGGSSDPVSIEFASSFASWLSRDDARIADNGGNLYTSSATALAYDSYMLVVEAIKDANSGNSQAVMGALRTISYDGVTGSISFDKNGESEKKLAYIKTINTKLRQFDILQISSVGN